MADFCLQCATALDFPTTDMAKITTAEEWGEGLAAIVLCEGCGVIQVDPEGRCVTKDCFEKHGEAA